MDFFATGLPVVSEESAEEAAGQLTYIYKIVQRFVTMADVVCDRYRHISVFISLFHCASATSVVHNMK